MWLFSVMGITLSFFIMRNTDYLTLIDSLIGVSALIFVAKGNVIGQVMTVIFGVFYGIISAQYHYWSEVITYLGMTAPIALGAVATWIRHPYEKGEVKVREMKRRDWVILALLTIAVTILFSSEMARYAEHHLFDHLHRDQLLGVRTGTPAFGVLRHLLRNERRRVDRSLDACEHREYQLFSDGPVFCDLPDQRPLRLLQLAENQTPTKSCENRLTESRLLY